MTTLRKITPCLWFDDQAEQEARFYVDIFADSRILAITRYGEADHEVHGKAAGTVMTVSFELAGQTFTALNGGPVFKFNEAISFQVACDTSKNSTTTGTSSPTAETRTHNSAAGSRTDTACPGRSAPASCSICSRMRIRPRRSASCRHCCR